MAVSPSPGSRVGRARVQPVHMMRIHRTTNPEFRFWDESNSPRGNTPHEIQNLSGSNTLKSRFLRSCLHELESKPLLESCLPVSLSPCLPVSRPRQQYMATPPRQQHRGSTTTAAAPPPQQPHHLGSTTAAAPPQQHHHSNRTTAAAPRQQHRHGNTTTTTLHGSTTTATPPRQHYTAAPLRQHHRGSTTTAAPPQQHHHGSVTRPKSSDRQLWSPRRSAPSRLC